MVVFTAGTCKGTAGTYFRSKVKSEWLCSTWRAQPSFNCYPKTLLVIFCQTAIVQFAYDQVMMMKCVLRNPVQTCNSQVLGWHLWLECHCCRHGSWGFAEEGKTRSGERWFIVFLPCSVSAVWEDICVWDIRDSGLVIRLGLFLRACPEDAAFRDGKEQNCPVRQLLNKLLLLPFWRCALHP